MTNLESTKEERIKFKNLNKDQKHRIFMMLAGNTIVFVLLLVYFCSVLLMDGVNLNRNWYDDLKDAPEQAEQAEKLSKHAKVVKVGTYVDNLRRVDLKNSEFRMEILIWFDWEGDPDLDPANNFRIYKGSENSKTIVEEVHKKDGKNYQLVSMDVTVSKHYHTKRFPLESHQFKYYIESNDPIQDVKFESDHANSCFNENLSLTGYDFIRFAVGETSYTYDSTHGNPRLTNSETTSEVVAAFEIKRSDFGLYLKCFIALYATLIWMLISLYICTYHHVDPLSMIPAALFGAVGNIVIGTNLLPDASGSGLLEFGNIWGAVMILAATIAIISINRVRKLQDNRYSQYYGRFLFYLIAAFALVGEILLPLFAYLS